MKSSVYAPVLGLCAAFAAVAPGSVHAEGESCVADADCTSGESCIALPCASTPCAPGENCPPPPECPTEGICQASGGTDGGSCDVDEDCGPGFVCTVFDTEACNRIGCAGDDCPPPNCSTIQIRSCAPAPCESDGDCSDDLVCLEIKYGSCSGGAACPPNETCTPEPTVCTEHVEHYCGPRYTAPCTVDADCGEGFECLEATAPDCVCVSTPGGNSEPCECGEPEGSGTFYCSLIEVECSADADCPTDWTCVEEPSVTLPCTPGPDGSGCEAPPPPTPRSLCMPPAWSGGWGLRGSEEVPSLPTASGVDGSNNSTPPEVTGRASADVTGADVSEPGSCSAADESPVGLFALVAIGLMVRRPRRRR